jgi:hypothetical protein
VGWIDTIVITIVIVLGLLILYKALKEPVDLIFSWIGKGIKGLVNMVRGSAENVPSYDVINYG